MATQHHQLPLGLNNDSSSSSSSHSEGSLTGTEPELAATTINHPSLSASPSLNLSHSHSHRLAPEGEGHMPPLSPAEAADHRLAAHGSVLGGLRGMPFLGLRWRGLENESMRAHMGLTPRQPGVLVTAIDPGGSASSALRPGDVLTSIAGQAIAADGTVLLRPRQRVLFGFCSNTRQVGEQLPVTVLRGGQELALQLRLSSPPPLVPVNTLGNRPNYLIVAGLVLLQLTVPLLYSRLRPEPSRPASDRHHWGAGHLGIDAALERPIPTLGAGEQVVIMSELLDGSVVEEGYGAEIGRTPMRRLNRVNGVPILDMAQLAVLLVALTSSPRDGPSRVSSSSNSNSSSGGSFGSKGFLRLESTDGHQLVLDASTAKQDTIAALNQHSINHAMSARLRTYLSDIGLQGSWPFDPVAGRAQGIALQRRQQRRRVPKRRWDPLAQKRARADAR
ncbi:hypothetical protein V8C86DRAFT_2797135 [Haematococcus lacustris]